MNTKAPDGKIWKCQCCGKTSIWEYGFDDHNKDYDSSGKRYSDYGWDESCMMNCVLVSLDEAKKNKKDLKALYKKSK